MKKLLASFLALVTAGLLSAQEITFGVGARGFFGFGLGSSTNVAESYGAAYHDAFWEAFIDALRDAGGSGGTVPDYDPNWDDQKLSVKPFESILAGGAIIGRIAFDSVPGLYIQPEIGFSHNQVKYKYSWEYSKSETKKYSKYSYDYEQTGDGSMSYNAIDIPIIAGYDVDLGHGMVVSPYGGLNLSIPIGKLSWSRGADTWRQTGTYAVLDGNGNQLSSKSVGETEKNNSCTLDSKIKNGVIPGLILGTGFGYKFDDHNMIMGDLRYLLDFIPVKAETDLKEASKAESKKDGTSWSWDSDSDKYNKDFRFDTFCRRALTIGVSYVYFF